MKLLLAIAMLFGPCKMLFAQSQLEVVVSNVKNNEGTIRVGIFRDQETFLKKAVYGKVVNAEIERTIVLFDDMPPGKYSVSIIHDENGNEELDTNLLGVPKEGIGFSNDARGSFGPPSFEKTTITVETGKRTITILMRYL
jgi:uncharacterized protein (DUF2141 family)